MYVCICKAITDREIEEAAGKRICPAKDILKKMGVASDCGQCAKEAKTIVEQTQARHSHNDQD